jgi:DNA-binding transcriptional LysR family regulator
VQWVDRIGRRLKLRDLHILMAVVQSGSMAKAARDLAVSQPVVSKTIADLEHTLSVRLLDRSAKGVTPTTYGRALLNRGLAAFDELRQGVKEIEFLSDPTVGDVRIGATAALIEGLLPVVIARLRREHPRLTVHVTQGLSGAALFQNLRERSVDFIIARISSRTAERDLSAEILFDEPQFVMAGAKNPLVRRRNIKLVELINEPWILPPADTMAGALIADTFHAEGLAVPEAAIGCTSFQMMGVLLATGPFLAMFPRSLVAFGAKGLSVKVLPVRLPTLPRPVGLLILQNRTLSATAQLFIDRIREVARPLALNQ